jgi:hypothetical protein
LNAKGLAVANFLFINTNMLQKKGDTVVSP